MAEELERPDVAVDEGASTEAAASTGEHTEGRQPEAPKGVPSVNLDDLPQFRQWKSQADKRDELNRRALLERDQRLQSIEQQLHEQRMAGMDAEQRLQYENQILKQTIAKTEQQRQLDFLAWQRDRDINSVATALGLDRGEVEAALPAGADSFVLWETAYSLQQKKGGKAPPRSDQVRQVANTVDLGGGPPASATNKYQQMYDDAKKSYDAGAMIDAMAAAAGEGIRLRE